MALKDKTSLYDLVPGPDAPVGDFEDSLPTEFGSEEGKKIGKQDLHLHLLENQYQYNYNGSIGKSGGPNGGELDLNGQPGHSFNLRGDSTLQPDSLLSVYNGIQGSSPFTAGPVPLPGHFADLDGGLPSTGKYENNGPDGGFY
jgi:hypothetical protein